ncbi:hypothetical protein Peur_013602 [Populus x canadensis]
MFLAIERIFLYVILALQTIIIFLNFKNYNLIGLSQHVDLDVATHLALVVADGLFNRMVFKGMDSLMIILRCLQLVVYVIKQHCPLVVVVVVVAAAY